MPLVLRDRVQEITNSTGTGTITLAGAVAGFQSFSVIGNGNTTYYAITGGTQWELGIGTYTASGTTLSRDTVLSSSNNGNLVDFAAGSKTVFVTYPTSRVVIADGTSIAAANSSILPVASGGTGSATAAFSGANITSLNASNVSSGTLANARTTASSSNGASTIVARGANGEFAAGAITGASFTGDGSAVTAINGSNISTGTVANARTTATNANGASTIVARDASGNFSANTITATLSGNATNVSGTVAIANGGTGATTAPTARTNLGATTVGSNMFTLTNPSAVTFPRFNADNTVSALDAATFRTAIGAGTGSGTVTSVSGTGTVSGLTLSGTVTSSGSLTLGGSISFPVTSVNGSTGAVTISTITGTSGSPAYYGSRCWVNFTGTGTVTVNSSVNVSSITDNGIGLYTVNFSTAMPDANYSTVVTNTIVSGYNGSTTDTSASNGGRVYTCFMCISAATAPTTSAVRVSQGNSYYGGDAYDPGTVNVVIFR